MTSPRASLPSGPARDPGPGWRRAALVAGVLLQLAALEGLLHLRPGALILLLHVAGAFAWGVGTAALLPAAQRSAWWLPGGCALIFPGLGPLASLWLMRGLRTRKLEDTDHRYVIWNQQPHESLNDLPAAASAQSIAEILQSPRTQLRRNAILALRDLDPPLAIPLLRKGLQDSDEQVRIYAQNILSAMLETFEARIKDLEAKFLANPRAAATARRLAEQFFELVYLDVAGDEAMASHYLGKALELLEHAFAANPADREIALLGLKFALRARYQPLARLWYDRIPSDSLTAPHVLPWRMELAFLENDWPEMRRLFATFLAAGHINPRIDEIIRFWHGPAGHPS